MEKLSKDSIKEVLGLFQEFGDVLGVDFKPKVYKPKVYHAELEEPIRMKDEIEVLHIPAEVVTLIKEREEARKNKDWKKADELRDKIKEKGFWVSDTPKGPKIEKLTS